MKSSHQTPHGYPIKKFKNSKPPDHSKNLKNPNNANLHIVSNNDQKFSSSANNYNRNESSLSEESIGKNKTLDPSKISPYQYMRTIRFRGVPIKESEYFKSLLKLSSREEFDLKKLSEQLSAIKEDLEYIFYFKTSDDIKNKESDNNYKLNKKISVKQAWLKRYHKNIFYLLIKDNKTKTWNLSKDLTEIHNEFNEYFNSLKEMIINIEQASKAHKESQHRDSDVSYSINMLNKKCLPYYIYFFRECKTSDPEMDKRIKSLLEQFKKIQSLLKKAEENYSSNESSGIEIAKASFNYYTVNKKTKYYADELEKTNKKLKEDKYYTLNSKNGKIEFKFSNKVDQSDNDIYRRRGEQKNKSNRVGQSDNGIYFFKSALEIEWIKRWVKKELKTEFDNETHLTLDQTYSFMKSFKAEQKSIFYEVISHVASGKQQYSVPKGYLLEGYNLGKFDQEDPEHIKEAFSLFQFKDKKWGKDRGKEREQKKEQWYEEFINLFKKISDFGKHVNETKNQKEQKKNVINEREDAINKRGEFLFGKEAYFKEYAKFCEQYKKIAQDRGKLRAQIKGLEQEKLESQMIDYWSFIYVDNDKKQLWLIPKEKIKNARKFIYNSHGRKDYVSGDTSYLCCFESLTMRALHKLCFSPKSSFVKKMPEDLKNLQEEAQRYKTDGDEQKVKCKNKKKLLFFKKLLKSDYFKRGQGENKDTGLFLENFDLRWVYDQEVKFLNEFEKRLENSCYYVKRIKLNDDEKKNFIQKHNVAVLDITSYDIEGRNTKRGLDSKNRYHTDLWDVFWEGVGNKEKKHLIRGFKLGEIRLNPEIKIFYRKADDELKNYFNQNFFPENFKHRKKQDQITLAFTLALNAGGRYEDLAFCKPEDLEKKIDEFNEEFNKKLNFETAWKYGIDRGQAELATLCLVKNGDKKFKPEDSKKPEFAKLKTYTLKDYDHKVPVEDKNKSHSKQYRKAIENLSYFITDNDEENKKLFDVKWTSCLDLTTAKVIKGKIVTNGDVMTYLKLKKESAKRKLYELYSQGKLEEALLEYKDDKICIKNHDCEREKNQDPTIVYHYCSEYSSIVSREKIKNNLSFYLKTLLQSGHSEHTPSVKRINHLRDAIVANMIGVISHLQKEYPGFILLEDLAKDRVEWHFEKSNKNISRKLEYKLYNQFQARGFVPPHVKNIIQLREDLRGKQNKKSQIRSSQIGVIVFVDEEDTSQMCPDCSKKVAHEKETKKDLKYKQKRFYCGECGFDTYLFKPEEERMKDCKPEVTETNKGNFEYLSDLDDPDKVAAFNIARKIENFEKICKWDEMLIKIKK